MDESACWVPQLDNFSILWNPKDLYRVCKSAPLVPTLRQMKPVYVTFCSFRIHFNIMLSSTPGTLSGLFPLGLQW